jgi:hypothetical protein
MANLSSCFNLLSRTKPPVGVDCEWVVLLNHGTCQGAGRWYEQDEPAAAGFYIYGSGMMVSDHNRTIWRLLPEPHSRPIPPLDATRQLILKLTAELARLHDSKPQALDLITEARAFIDATHPRPIPVAERLPTEADCDAEGKVWAWDANEEIWYREDVPRLLRGRYVFLWLPAAAIPLPQQETTNDR